MQQFSKVVRAVTGAAVTVAAFAAAPAGAQQVFQTPLSGAQQVPPVSTPASGFATVTFNGTNLLNVNVTFAGLTSGTLFAHIHAAAPLGANAPVALPFVAFPVGVTSGSYNNTFDLNLAATYEPAFLTANGGSVATARATLLSAMTGGLSYVNVHSANFPGGEIRGQLAVVPEPSTYALMAGGLATLGAAAARRRRAARV